MAQRIKVFKKGCSFSSIIVQTTQDTLFILLQETSLMCKSFCLKAAAGSLTCSFLFWLNKTHWHTGLDKYIITHVSIQTQLSISPSDIHTVHAAFRYFRWNVKISDSGVDVVIVSTLVGSVESQRMFLRPQKTELGRFSLALWGSRKKVGRRWMSYSIMDKSEGSYCVDQQRFIGPLLTDTSETHRTVSGNTRRLTRLSQ